MKIDISEAIKSPGEEFTSQFCGALPDIGFLGERYTFPDGVNVRVCWRYDGEGVIVTGRLDAKIPVRCARCLTEFTYDIGADFAEYFKKQPEEGMYAYEDETIDLTQMLEDNVVINLPTKLLCREDCKGLCSRCGADLNKGDCGCGPEPDGTNPFVGLLDKLK